MRFIDLEAQQKAELDGRESLRSRIDRRISNVLDHGQYILGPEVEELEDALCRFTGVDCCVGTASGTDALLVALMALGIGPGDEVITTSFSFIATTETIVLLGAKPVYVDIEKKTFNIDADKIECKISSKTKAIVAVSLYGQPAAFDRINELGAKYDIPVIEDGAQSFGATRDGKKSCNLSTIGTTSFFPSKPLGGYGDSGACFTNDRRLAEKIRRISRHGQSKRYFHTDLGVNGRIDTIQAAIVLAKLEVFEREIELRQRVADKYSANLQRVNIGIPFVEDRNTSVFAQYTVRTQNRDKVAAELKAKGIPTAVHYPTLLCKQPAMGECNNRCEGECHMVESMEASNEVLSLPMHPYMTDESQMQVIEAIERAVSW